MGVLVWVCGWVFLSWCTGMDLGLRYLDKWDFGMCSEAFWRLVRGFSWCQGSSEHPVVGLSWETLTFSCSWGEGATQGVHPSLS